jgi:hypothetical protein
VTAPAALDWVRDRNAETLGELSATPRFAALRTEIRQVLDADDHGSPLARWRGHKTMALLAVPPIEVSWCLSYKSDLIAALNEPNAMSPELGCGTTQSLAAWPRSPSVASPAGEFCPFCHK